MSWSVTFCGTAAEINAAFDQAAEKLRSGNPPIGEFEDLHQARMLTLATAATHDCQLSGAASGHWIGVDFQSFALTIARYIPPDEAQLPLPELVNHSETFVPYIDRSRV